MSAQFDVLDEDVCVVDQTLTFRAARQLCGTCTAQVHTHDVRRVHRVPQVQASGGDGGVKKDARL